MEFIAFYFEILRYKLLLLLLLLLLYHIYAGVYVYVPEKKYVSRLYSVPAIL